MGGFKLCPVYSQLKPRLDLIASMQIFGYASNTADRKRLCFDGILVNISSAAMSARFCLLLCWPMLRSAASCQAWDEAHTPACRHTQVWSCHYARTRVMFSMPSSEIPQCSGQSLPLGAPMLWIGHGTATHAHSAAEAVKLRSPLTSRHVRTAVCYWRCQPRSRATHPIIHWRLGVQTSPSLLSRCSA